MIEISKTDVYGWEAAIRGMRNPMNSWDKSDSCWCRERLEGCEKYVNCHMTYCVGENDLKLMTKLVSSGSDHSKFMRMITVAVDVKAPLYWWKEFDTYKVGTVANSCSTMHKIHVRDLTLDDFSHEHLDAWGIVTLNNTIRTINLDRDMYVNYDSKNGSKTDRNDYWYQMIQLLPSSYNQTRTVTLNYAVLRNMYHARKNHKLDEWHAFCDWIETLPYSELITME